MRSRSAGAKEGGRKIGKLSESGAVCISEIGEDRERLGGAHQKQGLYVLRLSGDDGKVIRLSGGRNFEKRKDRKTEKYDRRGTGTTDGRRKISARIEIFPKKREAETILSESRLERNRQ